MSVDRRMPPRAATAHGVTFPPFRRARLACGVQVLVARVDKVPLATLEIVFAGGAEQDPPERHGLATLAAGMLDEGTTRRDVHALARRVETTGSYLSTSADWDAAYVQCGGLARHWREHLEVLYEVVVEASFPAPEFERLRRQREAELLARRDQPGALADEAFQRTVYAGTPYDHPLNGDSASLTRTTREDAEAFHLGHRAPEGAALVVAGDVDPDEVIGAAAEIFAGWPAGAASPAAAVAPSVPPGRRVRLIDRPGAAQTELRVGHAGTARRDPRRPALRVLNALLGGKFTSRINLNLRERHGYTYGAFSRFADRRGPGPFVVSCAVSTEHAGDAVREILVELERVRTEPVSEEELADTKSYLTGIFPYSLQTADDVVDRLETLAIHDLPDDYHDAQLHALAQVDGAALLEAARRNVRPAEATIVAVGPRAELVAQLAPFGALVD